MIKQILNSFFHNPLDDKMKKIGSGLLPSPPDGRDYALSSYAWHVKRYPKEKPRPFDLKVHDQFMSPSCVGHSCASLKEGLERLKRNKIEFDGEWIYARCKERDGYDGPGTYFRTGLSVLKDLGAMPIGGGDPSKYRIKAYARVDDLSFNGLREALSVSHYLLGGWTMSSAGWLPYIVRAPRPGETLGGHATLLDSYEEQHINAQNSWGAWSWVHNNSGGYFKSKEDYLPFEAWAVLLDAPNEIETVGDKIIGYIASEYTIIKNGRRVTSAGLNLRKEPKIANNVIRVLPAGTEIKTTGEIHFVDNWNFIPVLTD